VLDEGDAALAAVLGAELLDGVTRGLGTRAFEGEDAAALHRRLGHLGRARVRVRVRVKVRVRVRVKVKVRVRARVTVRVRVKVRVTVRVRDITMFFTNILLACE
jgi:hypothetical protein